MTIKFRNAIGTCFVLVAVMLVFASNGFAQPYVCLPNCATDDTRNFVIAGPGLSSFVNNRFSFGLSSPAASDTIEIGVFDGDDATSGEFFSDWDQGGAAVLIFDLYADPTGEAAEDIHLGTWTGDGSSGLNSGNPMPDGEWFVITVLNSPQAISANGNYRYTLIVTAGESDPQSINNWSIRTDGTMIINAFETFFFASQIISENDYADVVPNFTPEAIEDPACYDPVTFDNVCVAGDPGCCLSGGTYDGSYTFYIDVAEGEGSIESWDGDFDFGSSTNPPHFGCVPDFVDVDTDDFNTPNEVPDFAQDTDAVPEGISSPTNPLDDSCNNFFVRKPSVFYTITSPDGDTYTNPNPSGSEEWELFLITSEGGGDVDLDDIPGGYWELKVEGLDLINLNGFRINFPVVAVTEEGDSKDFDPPVEPIPTLNEWGLISLTAVMFIMAIIYLRRKKNVFSETK